MSAALLGAATPETWVLAHCLAMLALKIYLGMNAMNHAEKFLLPTAHAAQLHFRIAQIHILAIATGLAVAMYAAKPSVLSMMVS
jgi:hypothetical protein